MIYALKLNIFSMLVFSSCHGVNEKVMSRDDLRKLVNKHLVVIVQLGCYLDVHTIVMAVLYFNSV